MNLRHSKLTEIVLPNFKDYSKQIEHFNNVNAAYFCLGAYTGTVPDDLFREITVDYCNAFADAIFAKSPASNFCLLSGQGADQTEKSRVSFAKYKGMAENYLKSKNFGGLYLFRPGYIYPVQKRQEPNLMYRISRAIYPLFKLLGPKYSITSEELGQAIFKAGISGASKEVLENEDILHSLTSS